MICTRHTLKPCAANIAELPRLREENGITDVAVFIVDTAYCRWRNAPRLLTLTALSRKSLRRFPLFRFHLQFEEVTLEADPETITRKK